MAQMNESRSMRFVLCRPQDPKNVAAAYRAIRATGVGDLAVVDALPGAVDALDQRDYHAHESLSDAVAECALAVGTTRRHGQRRKPTVYDIEDVLRIFLPRPQSEGPADVPVPLPQTPPVALVFGNEVGGLTDEELLSCNIVATIPSDESCPSLNLSHAVALTAYLIANRDRCSQDHAAPVGLRSVAELTTHVVGAINRMGFLTQTGPQGMEVFLRDLFARAAPSRSECAEIRGLFDSISDAEA